ncbi:hypothetical protein PK28_13430 [Hymenobacter sp. DG25B]|nr:hypothetical protein PK28_13430 [Hymenobacter sp. DG25B]
MKYPLLKIAVVAGLCAGAGTASAQTADSSAASGRWYVGAGAGLHHYYSINRPYNQLKPAYVQVGYTIKPRVALQAEIQYGRRLQENRESGEVDGELYDFYYKEDTRSTAVTVMARFSRSRPQRHLQFDWLLGLAVVRGTVRESSTRTSATQTDTYNYHPITATEPHLVGGIGLRYLMGPHWAIGTEILVSKNLQIPPISIWGLAPGAGANIGVSYLLK